MQSGLDGQEVGEVIAEDELGGPFLDVDYIDVVGEHAELGTLQGIFPAQAVEIVTQVAMAESMTIDGNQGEVGHQCLLGVNPGRGIYFRISVQGASQVVVAAAMAVFGLPYHKHIVAIGTDAEDVFSTRETIVSLTIIDRCLQAQVLMVVGVMDAHCGHRESWRVDIPADGGKDAGRAVGVKGQSVATEIILVDAADAGKERMAVVDLPVHASHRECKRNVKAIGVDTRETLNVVY